MRRWSCGVNNKSAWLRRGAAALLAVCMCLAVSGAYAQGRALPVAANIGASAEREAKTYTAQHKLLGVSSRQHESMIEINEDYAGWLEQPDTPIDYPIAQADDNDLYMNHSFTLESSSAGSLFLDYRNGAFFRDANCVVYGHHMKDDSMLATLVGYKEQPYYEEHPTLNLYTPYGDYTVEVFSGVIVSGAKDFLEFNFDDETAFEAYWQPFIENSTFECDIVPKLGDRLISFITCTYEFDDARYIVCGRLKPVDVVEE